MTPTTFGHKCQLWALSNSLIGVLQPLAHTWKLPLNSEVAQMNHPWIVLDRSLKVCIVSCSAWLLINLQCCRSWNTNFCWRTVTCFIRHLTLRWLDSVKYSFRQWTTNWYGIQAWRFKFYILVFYIMLINFPVGFGLGESQRSVSKG